MYVCVCVCLCAVPWCKPLQANVSLSLLGKFSVSLLVMQQSPGVKMGNTAVINMTHTQTPGMRARSHAHTYTHTVPCVQRQMLSLQM